MKFHCITLFSFLFITISTFAQDPWPAEDAEWYFDHEGCMTWNDLSHYYVSGTEDIQGVNSTVIHQITYFAGFDSEYEMDHIVYFNGDTLFWLFEDEFYPLLCFNLEVGDTWHPLPLDHPDLSSECIVSAMEVKEKSVVQYNGESYRQLVIGPELPEPIEWDDEWPHIVWSGTFDERTFGRGAFFPYYNMCKSVVEWDCPQFRCYTDSDLSLNVTGEECDAPLFVSIEETSLGERIKIYPNPITAGQQIYIDDIENYRELRIYSVDGRMLNQLNTADLKHQELIAPSPGNYIIQTEGKDGAVGYAKLVVAQ